MLKARGIRATFFLIGQNAAEYPDIVRRIAAEGHEIGNHTWNHPQLTKLNPAALREEIDRTSSTITGIIGKPLLVMRPPYDATSAYINHRMNREFGMKVILWSVDPLDWKYRNSARVERQILTGAQPGSIIRSHDIHATTVVAMPDVFDSLLAKGYDCDHHRFHAVENSRGFRQFTEPHIHPSQRQHDARRRKDEANTRDEQSGPAGPLVADVNRHLRRVWSGNQIRSGKQVQGVFVRKPPPPPHDFVLHHCDMRRGAAECNRAEFEKQQRKLL
jgi:hypothetical protein